MKNITSVQAPHHIAKLSIHSPLEWNGNAWKAKRCKLIDSFNFVKGLIEEEPYPIRNPLKERKPDGHPAHLYDRKLWLADFYKDDYAD
ncbi:MAG: hypothetical protein IPP15_11145 [Saprospiraceae bacterium]|uniref:Uncharacterized protein n=1 Tax=Candidatus Opimibacter skivensis TaxID=2982028 RepID=A0A9D7SVX6_9BACT|nr:hypothetical protein [Candidatus Opimibacter skivensis]